MASWMAGRLAFLFDTQTGRFSPDSGQGRQLPDGVLRALASHGALTFTAVPPGSGSRIINDHDDESDDEGEQVGGATVELE